MESYRWTYCLKKEQKEKLLKIIQKVKGLLCYIENNPTKELYSILEDYKENLDNHGILTLGTRVNIDLIIDKYRLFEKEYICNNKEINNGSSKEGILVWDITPEWAKQMKIDEIDYLEHFICNVPGLLSFLKENLQSKNLYDLISFYQMRLNAMGLNNSSINFILETIKERFYRIMNEHSTAIHYVNHSIEIDETNLISNFEEEFRYIQQTEDKKVINNFYKIYNNEGNSYIASKIFVKLFRENKVKESLDCIRKSLLYTFSSPNIYWHNKESIYGSSVILSKLIESLTMYGLKRISDLSFTYLEKIVKTIYLLLSRTIYWSDMETIKEEEYNDNGLPINIQHKLRAYRYRAQLLEDYGNIIYNKYSSDELIMMAYSDLFIAHEVAFVNKIVGNESIYKNDALRLYHTKELFKLYKPDHASEEGFIRNDNLAQNIYKEYSEGKLCLKKKEIDDILEIIQIYFCDENRKASLKKEAIPYLKKDNFSVELKREHNQICTYLKDNNIKCFYHFTEKDRIKSIKEFGGLLSYKRCLDEGIVMPVQENMAMSRDIDAKLGLEDYARLSFSKRLPKIIERQKEGAELVMLKISTEVALFEETMFTDIEATHSNLKYGKNFEDLKRVNLKATSKNITDSQDHEYLQSQAEILVKGFIPAKYILNLNNPETIL